MSEMSTTNISSKATERLTKAFKNITIDHLYIYERYMCGSTADQQVFLKMLWYEEDKL